MPTKPGGDQGDYIMRSMLKLGTAAIVSLFAAPALAQTAPPPAATEAAAVGTEEIVVIGRGQVRQAQTLQAEALQALPAGTSPILAVKRLPGVAVSGADTFGAYEWAARINIRGFAQNQLGFTLDGVPLGDMSYANHNGLHISRASISENLGSATLTQGSGAIDVASSSNLGGALQFASLAPQETLGGVAAVTVGSDELRRYFGRFETGVLPGVGTRAWLSYMSNDMDKYKGEGPQKQTQWAIKAVQPIGKGELTGYYNDSKRRETDYQDMSLGMIQRLGYDWDNFGKSKYGLAVQVADIANNRGETGAAVTNPAAGTTYPAPIQTVDDAYFDASGLRDDQLGYVKLDVPVTDFLDIAIQAYDHQNKGQGLWGTPYVASPLATTPGATTNNSPISIRTTEYDIDRTGWLGNATLRLGAHTINGGFWTEDNDFTQARRFYGLDRNAARRSFTSFQTNPFFTQWAYAFATKTTQLYLQDTWQVTDALKVNAGFKSLKVENAIRTTTINNAAPTVGADSNLNGTIEAKDDFLPQIGATYKLTDDVELFASYAENMAAFPSVVGSVFGSRSQAIFNETKRTINPESSKSFEGGVRLKGDRYQLGAAAYLVKFEDRLLAVSQGPGIVGNAAILSNVGGVDTKGIELVGSYKITDTVSLFGSYTYNKSEYADDVRNRTGAVVTATSGKTVVNTPESIVFAEAAYDNDVVFARLSANYIGDRYFTYTNNGGKVDGRTLVDLTLGYRLKGAALLDGFEAQLNVANLLDEEYVGTLGTNGFVNSGDSQTVVTGAPRQVFVTLRKTF